MCDIATTLRQPNALYRPGQRECCASLQMIERAFYRALKRNLYVILCKSSNFIQSQTGTATYELEQLETCDCCSEFHNELLFPLVFIHSGDPIKPNVYRAPIPHIICAREAVCSAVFLFATRLRATLAKKR